MRFGDQQSRLGPVCANGEHTRSLLLELGYKPEEIDQMVTDGVIVEWKGNH